ncbi:hypothetical protein BC827DRAFT_707948 [Russula dissimulans]|nr:hypothetical protein BC827DRAFT_707948 [Russula dissimulans]
MWGMQFCMKAPQLRLLLQLTLVLVHEKFFVLMSRMICGSSWTTFKSDLIGLKGELIRLIPRHHKLSMLQVIMGQSSHLKLSVLWMEQVQQHLLIIFLLLPQLRSLMLWRGFRPLLISKAMVWQHLITLLNTSTSSELTLDADSCK